jgi:hypothetical protein
MLQGFASPEEKKYTESDFIFSIEKKRGGIFFFLCPCTSVPWPPPPLRYGRGHSTLPPFTRSVPCHSCSCIYCRVFRCATHPAASTRSFLLARLLYSVGHAQSRYRAPPGRPPSCSHRLRGKEKKEKGDAYFFKSSGLPHSFDSRVLAHSSTSFGIPRKRRKNSAQKASAPFFFSSG